MDTVMAIQRNIFELGHIFCTLKWLFHPSKTTSRRVLLKSFFLLNPKKVKRAERVRDMYKQRNVRGSERLKDGESCLFLRQDCTNPGNSIYHFTASKICSFPVNHTTIIFAFSITVQPRYPHMLSVSLFHSPLMNFLPVSTHLQEGQCSQSHKFWDT